MFIELLTIESKDGRGRTRYRKVGRAQCDRCNTEFTRGNYNWQAYINDPKKLVFCSQMCSRAERRRGGLSDAQLRQKNLKLHGVEHSLQRSDVKNRSRTTMIERYGAKWPLQCERFKLQARNTLMTKHGVTNAFHIPSNVEQYDRDVMLSKSINTMKRNKTFHSSRAEERLYELLSSHFQHVDRQVKLPERRWAIDFYVGDIDTYIQVDGVYWHGLDRPIEEIRASPKPRDSKIARAWLNDREQDAWFAEHRLRLVRITDKDAYSSSLDDSIKVFSSDQFNVGNDVLPFR